jgi:predicted nucleic acid-binding protein
MNEDTSPPRVFFDSSVVIAGAFSATGASYILLQLASLTLLEGRISAEVRTEVTRNVTAKLPAALPHLRVLLDTALVEGAAVADAQAQAVAAYADPKDQPLLASAVAQNCRYLVTLNERDFWPPPALIGIVRPGALLQMLRTQLAGL